MLSWKASPNAEAANVLLWMLLAVPWWALPARAQSHARPTFALAVQVDAAAADGAECWETELLRRRVLHYANESGRHADLRVELDVEAEGEVALRLLRAGRLLAQRRLTHLPKLCADRRDTVALSIALALEHAPAEARDPPATARASILATTPTPSSGSLARSDGSTSARDAEAPGQASATAQTAGTTQVVPEAAAPASAAVSAPSAPEGSPTPQPPTAAQPPPVERNATRARAPEIERGGPALLHLHLHLGGRWLVNASPSSVFAATAGLELQLARALSLELSGLVSNAGEARFARGIAQTRLLGGELLGCRAWALGDVGLQGCVGAIAAACRADGRDYPVGEPTKTLLWVAGQAGIALRWPRTTTVALRFLLLGHASVVRPELRVQGSEAPLTPGWVGGSIGLELVVTLQ